MQGNLEGRFLRANPKICGLKSPSRRNTVLLGKDIGLVGQSVILTL